MESATHAGTRQAIGEGEKVYDVTNLNMELQPNIIFRHRMLGFYDAGDLIVRTGSSASAQCAARPLASAENRAAYPNARSGMKQCRIAGSSATNYRLTAGLVCERGQS